MFEAVVICGVSIIALVVTACWSALDKVVSWLETLSSRQETIITQLAQIQARLNRVAPDELEELEILDLNR